MVTECATETGWRRSIIPEWSDKPTDSARSAHANTGRMTGSRAAGVVFNRRIHISAQESVASARAKFQTCRPFEAVSILCWDVFPFRSKRHSVLNIASTRDLLELPAMIRVLEEIVAPVILRA
jgi:hypothetical protein